VNNPDGKPGLWRTVGPGVTLPPGECAGFGCGVTLSAGEGHMGPGGERFCPGCIGPIFDEQVMRIYGKEAGGDPEAR
jgi:hypothetical protein